MRSAMHYAYVREVACHWGRTSIVGVVLLHRINTFDKTTHLLRFVHHNSTHWVLPPLISISLIHTHTR